ncbi:MAG: NADH-quinone oxidoreductase subunit L [Phycisphaerales bacterium]|nr:NADH-quinone oxidoreductase subunit L [Phycisphaerales bacterium]
MPLPALLLLISTLLPLAAFGVLLFAGRRLGNPLAGMVGTAFVAGSFACAIAAMIFWLSGGAGGPGQMAGAAEWGAGKGPIVMPIAWLPTGGGISQDHPGYLDVGLYVDSLTVAMFSMITLVALVVHLFSIGYMAHDRNFPRFFTYLSLFCFSMLGLVIGGTLLQIFVFWELVGLCSYLLIGFWHEKRSAANAATKAFVTNRIGDFGFLIGMGILFYHLGNVSLPHLHAMLHTAGLGGPVSLADGTKFAPGLLTIMGVGLFMGAMGKSAQFPLHTWLPDAMEGPTPVSALIHAATMVAAGVYLVGRIFPILTPDAKLFIAIIGCATLTIGALVALVQSDIKRVLAYSTISQLGYMMLALGLGSWVGGMFHLLTHAFFKALLFLGAGSVIVAAGHEQEMVRFGGLWRKIPVTAVTFLIAVLAIAGTPFFSGFYSKEMILRDAGAFSAYAAQSALNHGQSAGGYWLFFIVPTAVAYLTAFYMMRCWMLTFWGKPRDQKLYAHARESAVMYVPLVLLAVLSIIGGKFLGIEDLLNWSMRESSQYCTQLLAKDSGAAAGGEMKFAGFATAWPAHLPNEESLGEDEPVVRERTASQRAQIEGHHLVLQFAFWAFAVGMGLAGAVYWKGYAVAEMLLRIPPARWIRNWLYRGMYFDELYQVVWVDGIILGLAAICRGFDRRVIDGAVNGTAAVTRGFSGLAGWIDRWVVDGMVNGAGELAHGFGAAMRSAQSGRIRLYVMVLMAAVALGLAGAVLMALSG